jgi:hypothetical protein
MLNWQSCFKITRGIHLFLNKLKGINLPKTLVN